MPPRQIQDPQELRHGNYKREQQPKLAQVPIMHSDLNNKRLIELGAAKFKRRIVQDTPRNLSDSENEDYSSYGPAQCSRASSSTLPLAPSKYRSTWTMPSSHRILNQLRTGLALHCSDRFSIGICYTWPALNILVQEPLFHLVLCMFCV